MVSDSSLSPIDSWLYLLGLSVPLGWGQIQMANQIRITTTAEFPKGWMLEVFGEAIVTVYPKELTGQYH